MKRLVMPTIIVWPILNWSLRATSRLRDTYCDNQAIQVARVLRAVAEDTDEKEENS